MQAFTGIIPAVALLTITITSAFGAGMDASRVPAGATWLMHFNAEAFKQTELGNHMLDRLATPKAANKLAAFQKMFQFDPREDIRSLTLYGVSAEKGEGVMLLEGTFDTDQLEALVKANAGHSSEVHGSRIVHSWIDTCGSAQRKYGSVVRNDLVVVGRPESLVKLAVDVLEGRATSMLEEPSLPGLSDAHQSTIFMATAEMKGMQHMKPRAALLRQSEAVSLSISETAGELQSVVRMVAKDTDAARSMHAIAQGLVSLAALKSQQNPDLVALAQSLQMARNDEVVTARLDFPVADMIRLMQMRQARMQALQGAE